MNGCGACRTGLDLSHRVLLPDSNNSGVLDPRFDVVRHSRLPASTFGAVKVTFNGIVQNWAFNDGYPTTKVRFFNLDQDVVDSINATSALTIVIDRNGSTDFYGFDYARLEDAPGPAIPEPSTYAMMGLGLGAIGMLARRRRKARESLSLR